MENCKIRFATADSIRQCVVKKSSGKDKHFAEVYSMKMKILLTVWFPSVFNRPFCFSFLNVFAVNTMIICQLVHTVYIQESVKL